MKRLATLSIILLCGSVGYAQSLNPTGYWEYNNNFISTGSNVTNVVTNSNAATATRAGVVGTSANFNGTNQQLTLNVGFGTGSSLAGGYNLGGSFTVSTWYFIDSLGTGSKRTYINEGRTSFDISYGNPSAIATGRVYGPTTDSFTDVTNSMSTGAWRQMTQVYSSDGTTTSFTAYLDGVLVRQASAASSGVGDTGIKLANARDGQSRFLDGALDETAVYDRALTANEAIRSYRMGENGITLTSNAAMWAPTVTNSEWLSSGANNNWSLGAATFAGEGNNAASTNNQIALFSTFAVNPATVGIDFADPAVAGELGLGAIVFNSQSNNLAINNSSSTAGIVTLNSNTVNSIPNTIFSVGNSINTTGSANRNLTVGDGSTGTLGIRLGNTANVVQVASGRTLTLNSTISERNALSTVTMQGGGTALFNRNTSYTGNTTVTGTGTTLQYGGGTNHTSSVTVATGAGLSIVNIGTNVTASNTQNLTFDTGATQLRFTAATWNTSVPFLDIDGAVTTNGTTTITALPNATGVYTLVNYGSLAGNGFAGFALAAFPTSRESGFLVDDSPNNAIKLNYTAGANVLWTGANTGTWDINTTENWKLEPSNAPTTFLENDRIIFDDSATGTTAIALGVNANIASVVFHNTTKNYEISGVGGIAGSSTLVKSGTGSVTLLTNNTYTGATTVNEGTLQIGNGGTTGSIGAASAIAVNTPGTVRYSRSDTLVSLANIFSGSGALEFLGTGVSTESGYQLTANNSGFTGTITATQARVRFDSQNNAGVATLTTSTNGQFFLVGGIYANTFNIAGNGWTETAGQLGALRMTSGATITGPVNLLGNARLTNFASSETGTISGVISGNYAIEKTGDGTLTITNANTYTGGTTINDGRVNAGNATALGTGAITVGEASSFGGTYVSGGAPFLAVSATADTVLANNIVLPDPVTPTSFFALQKLGTGSNLNLTGVISGGGPNMILQLDSPTGGDSTTNFTLSGTNTLAGTVRLNRGYITIANANALGTAALFVQTNANAAGSIRFTNSFTLPNDITINTGNNHISVGANNVELSGILASSVSFQKLDSGILTLSNDSNAMNATLTIAEGTLQIGKGGATGSFGAGNIVNNAALVFNRTGTLNFPSVISGAGSVTQNGTGTTILTGNSTYSGQTTINSGTLSVDDGSIAFSSNIVNNAALVFSMNTNAGNYPNAISGTGSLTKSGTNTLSLDGENTYAGGTAITAGTLKFSKLVSMPATGVVAVGTGSTLAVNVGGTGEWSTGTTGEGTIGGLLSGLGGQAGSTVTYTGAVNLGLDTTNAAPATQTYASVIGNVGTSLGITKLGANSLELTAANIYTGGTTINAGTLLVNNTTGSGTGTGAVSVSALATLGGTGTVGGLTTVASTGIVAPGNSAGNLTFAGGVDLSAGGVYSWELGSLSTINPGVNFDTITVSGGNLALGGTSALTLDFNLVSATDPNSLDTFWTSGKSWKIIDVTTGTNTGNTNLTTITNASYTSGSFTTTVGTGGDAGDIFLVFTPVVVSPPTWIGASDENWTAGTSWTGSVPNSTSAEAQFTTTGGAVANLDIDQTVNKLTFDATTSNDYTISGPGKLILAGTTPSISTTATNTGDQIVAVNLDLATDTTITVNGSTLSLNVPTTNPLLGSNVTATVAMGATLNLGGAGNALSNGTTTHANVTNNGTLAATTAGKRVGNITGTGTTTVTAAGATLTANHVRQAGLTIGAGNNVTVAANGGDSGVSRVTALSINATGQLDLNNNDLIVNNGNLAAVTLLLKTGLDITGAYGGGPGITSTTFAANPLMNTALGVAANSELGYTTFSGQTVDSNDILVKYTYFGDADLNGVVDTATDFDLYITGLTSGGSLGGWLYGDFDYNGTVDTATDFDLYITGLTSQGGALLTAGSSPIQAVPEPGTLVLGGLALLGLAGLKLRRKKA